MQFHQFTSVSQTDPASFTVMVTLVKTREKTIHIHMSQPNPLVSKRNAQARFHTFRTNDQRSIRLTELHRIYQQIGQHDTAFGGIERNLLHRSIQLVFQPNITSLKFLCKIMRYRSYPISNIIKTDIHNIAIRI